jgi:hypothetical protein
MEELEKLVQTMTDAPLTMDQRIALIQSLALAEIAKSLSSVIGTTFLDDPGKWFRVLKH